MLIYAGVWGVKHNVFGFVENNYIKIVATFLHRGV